jgi:hypothetical protein
VVETDGVMIRYRDHHLDGAGEEGDWHEVELGLAGGWQAQGRHRHCQVAVRDHKIL